MLYLQLQLIKKQNSDIQTKHIPRRIFIKADINDTLKTEKRENSSFYETKKLTIVTENIRTENIKHLYYETKLKN